MKRRPVRSRAAVAYVTSTLSLALLLTGCSGSGDSDAKALTAAELKKLVIAGADLDGYTVETGKGGAFADPKSGVKVADEKCEPLGYVMTASSPGDSEAYVDRTATAEGIADPTSLEMTVVSLSSYDGDGDGAEKTMASVSDAVDGCAAGFEISSGDKREKYARVAAEKASGSGDESVAFAVTSDREGGDSGTVHGEVVRHGNTIATYYTLNLGAMMSKADDADGDEYAYDIPSEVIKAQAAKLG